MEYLYIDNFHGFSKTSVKLTDVNFLVGENSTGKTSILTVLRMFSSPNLLMGSEELTVDPIRLGHFAELVSVHSNDKSCFRLGYVDEIMNTRTKEKRGSGILITYKNIGGLANINRLSCTISNGEIHIKYENNKIFYWIDTTDAAKTVEEAHARLLGWVDLHDSNKDDDWKLLPDVPEDATKVPLIFVLAMAISSQSTPKRTRTRNFSMSLSFPHTAPSLIWIAPIRSKPLRTYDEPQTIYSAEGSHAPYVIKRMLNSAKDAERFREFMERVGEASGLFQKIEINYFGSSETSPFEVDAYLDGAALNLGWMGYGVSQSLPILVELLVERI